MAGTPVLIDSFDGYTDTSTGAGGLQQAWTSIGAASVTGISLQTGIYGTGQALQATAQSITTTRVLAKTIKGGALSSGAIGVAFCCTGALPSGTGSMIHILSGSTSQFAVQVNTSGAVQVERKTGYTSTTSTNLGTSANGLVALGNNYYLEVEFTVNSTSGAVSVYLNGNLIVGPLTSVNTSQSAANNWDGIGLSSNNQGSSVITYDDVYGVDSASRLGPQKCKVLYPASDVLQGFSRSTGAANYPLVNEAHADGDTSYVQGALSALDRYTFDALGFNPSTVSALQLFSIAESTDVFLRRLALQVKSGATVSDGSDFALSAGSYSRLERILATDPNTAAAWIAANVPPQAGPKVTQ